MRKALGLPGVILSPLVDIWTRSMLSRQAAPHGYRVEFAGSQEVMDLDTRDWQPRPTISLCYPDKELAWRYLDSARSPMRIAVILNNENDVCAYFAVAERSANGLFIWDYRTDLRKLTDPQALQILAGQLPDCSAILLRLLAGCPMAAEAASLGFVRYRAERRKLMGYWRSEHRLASQFGQMNNWSIMPAISDI